MLRQLSSSTHMDADVSKDIDMHRITEVQPLTRGRGSGVDLKKESLLRATGEHYGC